MPSAGCLKSDFRTNLNSKQIQNQNLNALHEKTTLGAQIWVLDCLGKWTLSMALKFVSTGILLWDNLYLSVRTYKKWWMRGGLREIYGWKLWNFEQCKASIFAVLDSELKIPSRCTTHLQFGLLWANARSDLPIIDDQGLWSGCCFHQALRRFWSFDTTSKKTPRKDTLPDLPKYAAKLWTS